MTAKESTEHLWAERVRAWQEAGGSAESFAKGKGFSGSALRMWRSRLSAGAVSTSPRIVALVPRSSMPASAPGAGELIIEIGAARVRVAAGVDRALLADVIGVLGAAR